MFTLVLSASAFACSVVGPLAHELTEDASDTTPPALPTGLEVAVSRGQGPSCFLGRCGSSSCDDLGFLTLTLDPAADDVSPPESVGYNLRILAGEAPPDLGLEGTWRPSSPSTPVELGFAWIDEATDDQEPIAFVLGVRAVDAAGNESEEASISVNDPGRSAGGCASAPAAPAVVVLVAAGVTLGRRARRG